MSNGRRFTLPSQKGTQLWPQTTQAPAKLVIKGVPADAPLYHAVADVFAGRLKAFHAKAQQTYAMSNNQVHKQRFDWGDARATYTNIQGQEIIELEVDVPVVEAISRQISESDYWGWALIEVKVPQTNIAGGVAGATLKAHRSVPAPNETGILFDGYVFDHGETDGVGATRWSDGLDPFVMSWAPQDNPIRTITLGEGVTQTSALLVDLRRFPKVPVVIELYGFLQMAALGAEQIVGYERVIPGTSSGFFTNLGPVTYPAGWPFDPNGNLAEWSGHVYGTNLALNDGFEPYRAFYLSQPLFDLSHDTYIPSPPMVFVTGTSSLSPPAATWNDTPIYHNPSRLLTGLTEYVYYQHFDPSTGSSSPNSFLATNIISWTINPLNGFVSLPNNDTRLSDICGVGGKGWSRWVQTLFDAPFCDFAWWDFNAASSGPIQTSRIGRVTIGSNPDIIDTLPYKLLGTVTIDPVRKSISFRAAR